MAKSFTLGNGDMLVGLDQYGQVYDLYFPLVGQENQTGGDLVHKIGIYVDDSFSWFGEEGWKISPVLPSSGSCSRFQAVHEVKKVTILMEDVVYNESCIFIRKFTVTNNGSAKRVIKLFINHQFEIYESKRGDTAYYDPQRKAIIHHKGRRIFLINAMTHTVGIDDYSVGLFAIEGKEGTYKDAEDGVLEKNPIEHGFVDSVISFTLDINAGKSETVYYWITISKFMKEAQEMNNYVIEKTPAYLMETTNDYWNAWVNRQKFSFYGLDESISDLFRKSLLIIRSHLDNRGAVIASCDSDILKNGRDTYSYMWPRDGAFTVMALDKAGYTNVTKNFFRFCNDVITDDGYFMHKYRADQSIGSSWHPWVREGELSLPIQEDETALIIYALWHHYAKSKDLEFIEKVYNSLIRKAADFMTRYIDESTGLPKPSYDLWEEKYGVSTFTAASVYGGLIGASRFAGLLGKDRGELLYQTFAEKIKKGILDYLYDEKDGYFYKLLYKKGKEERIDKTLDVSSIYSLYAFDLLDISDEKIEKSIKLAHDKLQIKTQIGGFPRYEDDYYYRVSKETPGNPWIITTLWIAQYYIKKAKQEKDLNPVVDWLHWACSHALPSGILSEQINPLNGEQLSASPLVWSHAEYVVTVLLYLEKLEKLGICKVSLPD